MLFRNIALIFNLEKPCYLENRVSGGVPVVYYLTDLQYPALYYYQVQMYP